MPYNRFSSEDGATENVGLGCVECQTVLEDPVK